MLYEIKEILANFNCEFWCSTSTTVTVGYPQTTLWLDIPSFEILYDLLCAFKAKSAAHNLYFYTVRFFHMYATDSLPNVLWIMEMLS